MVGVTDLGATVKMVGATDGGGSRARPGAIDPRWARAPPPTHAMLPVALCPPVQRARSHDQLRSLPRLPPAEVTVLQDQARGHGRS
jgi:hypothetical protein